MDGEVLYSSEGTTRGDLLAMPMYALATIPLIKKLQCHLADVSQVWYADDASAAGKIDKLGEWWSQLSTQGPKYGYFANATKTWLVTKVKHLATATASFADTGVQVTSGARPYLGLLLVLKSLWPLMWKKKLQNGWRSWTAWWLLSYHNLMLPMQLSLTVYLASDLTLHAPSKILTPYFNRWKQ